MKTVFFNRFFFPDASATSQMLSDLAFHLAATGQEVHVVASGPPGATEEIRGVVVHRVAPVRSGPQSLAGRAGDYLRFLLAARRAAARMLARGDIAVCMTDPPLLSAAVAPPAAQRGARLIVWLQDLFPEVAREYGIPGTGGAAGTVLRRARDRSLARAERVVAVGERMAARVAALRCVPQGRLRVVHNWADGRAIAPLDRNANPLRAAWKLDAHFVVGYSGNLGRVHEFDALLDAAQRLAHVPDIRFLIVGRGPRLEEVRTRAARAGLHNLRFQPHQARERLAESLGAADVHLCVLRPQFEGLVQPSKIYGIMAAGRPTIFVGDRDGECARILSQARAGWSVDSGDGAGLAAAIVALRDRHAERLSMAANARHAFEARFDMPLAMGQWETLLAE